MPRTQTVSLEEFQNQADGQQLPAVTVDEYTVNYVNKPNLSLGGAIRRIRSSRKSQQSDDGSPREDQTVIGWAVGARQFSSRNVPFSESNTQVVTILTNQGQFVEFLARGNWTGQHGRKVEVELTRKVGKIFWNCKRTSTFDDRWQHKTASFQPLENLARYDLPENRDPAGTGREVVMVMGHLARVFPERNFDAQHDLEVGRTPELPYETDDKGTHNWPLKGVANTIYPTCSALLESPGVTLSAHFGPWKHGAPLVRDLEDWDVRSAEDASELSACMESVLVGVIGTITNVKLDVKNGQDLRRIHMNATAIVGLPEARMASAGQSATQAVPNPVISQPNVAAQALPSNIQDKISAIVMGITNARASIPANAMTPATLKQGGYVPQDIPDELINQALQAQNRVATAPIQTPATQTQANQKIVNQIKKYIQLEDNGDGVDMSKVVNAVAAFEISEDSADGAMQILIDDGVAYEPRLGVIRLL